MSLVQWLTELGGHPVQVSSEGVFIQVKASTNKSVANIPKWDLCSNMYELEFRETWRTGGYVFSVSFLMVIWLTGIINFYLCCSEYRLSFTRAVSIRYYWIQKGSILLPIIKQQVASAWSWMMMDHATSTQNWKRQIKLPDSTAIKHNTWPSAKCMGISLLLIYISL